MEKYVIAVDGFAGTGKGTMAKLLSKKLGILYIDSGAMYRAGGYYACKNGVEITEETIKNMLENIDIKLTVEDGEQHVYINRTDMNPFLRSPEANEYSSKIAVIGVYRKKMVEILRNISKEFSVIMDGRDIATVVFPNADVKFFLEASIDVRVKRRVLEYKEKGKEMEENLIKKNILERDERDATRKIDPLKKTKDSIIIDTSDKTIDEVVDIAYNYVKEKVGI